MQTRRVVLLSNHSLLAAGVRRLLEEVMDLELYIVAADDPEAAATIGQLAPTVIVLEADDTSQGEGVIPRILKAQPQARVVALSLNQIGFEVYRMEQILQTNLEGLLQAIQEK